jgi:O-antigen/teichoic acid export membrane protein
VRGAAELPPLIAMADTPAHSIGTRTLRGMFWAYGSFMGVRFASLLTTAILARLLTPKDFGLIALAMTFMTFLDMLQGLGVSEALVVAEAGNLESEAETAFAISTAMGVGLWLLSAALGPVAASVFHQPQLVAIMPALGATFLISSVGSTHYALAMKQIDFRSRTAAELADALFRGVVGVALAFAGAGVWSLIAGYIAGTIAMTVAVWHLVDWRPRFRPTRKPVRRLLGFGGALTGVGIMGAFLNQFDNAVVGRVLGATQLGFYSIANRLPYMFIISLAAATGQVLFPAFATLGGEDMRRGFLTSLRYTTLIALPLTVALITLAEPITLAVFGPHWQPAVAATQVLCLWALMSPVSMVCGNAIKSRGRATLLFMLAIPQAVVLIVGSLLLVHQGIVAVSWVQAAIAIVAQAVTLTITVRMLDVHVKDVLVAVGPPILASAVLAAVLYGIDHALAGPWLIVVVGGAAGSVTYLALIHVLARDTLPRLRNVAFPQSKPAQTQPSGTAALQPPADPAGPSVPVAPGPPAAPWETHEW